MRLVEVMDRAVAGSSGALFVSGEAGVGKTALVRAACGQMADVVDVFWATCLPLSSPSIPFLPLLSALREWTAGHPNDVLPPPLGRLGAMNNRDVPLLFDGWLQQVSRRRAVVLVVDDLQWADRSTLDVLMYVLAGLVDTHLAVIATVRAGEQSDTDPLQAWFADIRRFPRMDELRLGRLDRVGTRDQVAQLMGAQPRDMLVDEVFARACGNAYWTQLLVRELAADTRRLPEDLPTGLRQSVSRSWTRLSPAARELTRVVAIGGRPQGTQRISEVAAAAGIAGPAVHLLREAVDAGVLVRAFGDRYWFGHPLLAEVLLAGMLPGERETVYAAYAQVLDGIGAQTEGIELELATALADAHFGAGHLEDAYLWALQAAEAAELVGAAAETIRLLRRAVDLSYRLPNPRFEPGQILDRIRAAAEQAGQLEQELVVVDELLEVVDRTLEPLRVAQLLARRCDLRLPTGREFAGLADVREAVRLSAAEPDSPEHARAMAGLAQAELWHCLPSGPATAKEAVRLARSCNSLQALSYALTASAMAKVDVDLDGVGIDEAQEAQRAALEVGDWSAFVGATFWHANSIDGPACPATLDCQQEGRETLIALDAPHTYVAWLSASEAFGLLHLGRLPECQARLREVFGFSPGPLPDAIARLVAAQLAIRQGRRQEAESHVTRAEELLIGLSEFVVLAADAVRAELAVAAGDTERVLSLVPDVDEDNEYVAPTSVERLVPLAGQALANRILACHDHGLDARHARSQFQALRVRHPHVLAETTTGAMYLLQVSAMQAWYDAEFERAEQTATAGQAWLRAAEACQSALLAWDEAYARTRAAEALLPHRSTRRQGTAALRRARELAMDLQAVPLLAEIDALATSARVPLLAPEPVGEEPVGEALPARLPGLTPREREILAHLVVGRTYTEIAGALVISEKTVSVHVSNLLRKTGTASRVDLAQLVHRTTAQP